MQCWFVSLWMMTSMNQMFDAQTFLSISEIVLKINKFSDLTVMLSFADPPQTMIYSFAPSALNLSLVKLNMNFLNSFYQFVPVVGCRHLTCSDTSNHNMAEFH